MIFRSLAIAGFALLATVSIGARHAAPAAAAPAASTFSHAAPSCGGEPCDAVARGLIAFLDRRPATLAGNGRSCADCHMPTSTFQLSPADVEFRYRLLQLLRFFNPKADDPLFRPIDADDFRVNGDQASDFSNLRQNGLVRIVFRVAAKRQADRSGDRPALGRGLSRCVAQRTVGDERGTQRTRHQQPVAA